MKYNELKVCLKEISITLEKSGSQLTSRIDLKYGQSGVALFQFLYSKFIENNENSSLGEKMLDNIIENINSGEIGGRIPEQFSDFGRLIELLNSKNLFPTDTNSILADLDELQQNHIKQCRKSKDFDITTGLLVSGYYFISRINSNYKIAKSALEEIVEAILEISKDGPDGSLYWINSIKNKESIYLGISHGSSSIIVFLCKMVKYNIASKQAEKIIKRATSFILYQRKHSNRYGYFPIIVGQHVERCSLEWCYGDLGILYSLLLASDILNDEIIYIDTLKMLDTYLDMPNNKEATVDSGIAHGAAGTYYLFRHFYQLTNNTKYQIASQYWFNEMVNGLNKGNVGSYMAKYQVDITNGSHISFMSGIAGIGIMMIIYMNPDADIINDLLYM